MSADDLPRVLAVVVLAVIFVVVLSRGRRP